ncbi:MAG: Loki-CTERM sorting domain-containing protein [Candidatus Hodarchaeales archaeon]
MVELVTTTPLKNYHIANLPNGTFGLITKDNEDGKGHRGGIINNPTEVEMDGEIKTVKTSAKNNGVTIDLQYNFPSFSESLYYDPVYAAVATNEVLSEFETNGINTNTSDDSGIPGFSIDLILFSAVVITLIKIQKRRKE